MRSLAAEFKGDSAEESSVGTHHLREAQKLTLDDDQATPGAPAKRMGKLIEAAKAPAEPREYMDSGRGLNVLGRTDMSLQWVGSGLKCRGRFRDPNMIPHFLPTELAVLRRSSLFSAGRTFRTYLA